MLYLWVIEGWDKICIDQCGVFLFYTGVLPFLCFFLLFLVAKYGATFCLVSRV